MCTIDNLCGPCSPRIGVMIVAYLQLAAGVVVMVVSLGQLADCDGYMTSKQLVAVAVLATFTVLYSFFAIIGVQEKKPTLLSIYFNMLIVGNVVSLCLLVEPSYFVKEPLITSFGILIDIALLTYFLVVVRIAYQEMEKQNSNFGAPNRYVQREAARAVVWSTAPLLD